MTGRIVLFDRFDAVARALLVLAFGVILLAPFDTTGTGAGFRVLHSFGGDELWGSVAIVVGVCKLLGELYGPIVLLLPGVGWWALLAVTIGLSRPEGVGWVTYAVLFAMSAHHYLRRARRGGR